MDEFPPSPFPGGEKVATAWELSAGEYRLQCLHEERPRSVHTIVVQENGHELERHVLQDDPEDCIASYDRRNRLETDLRNKYYPHFERHIAGRRDAEAAGAE